MAISFLKHVALQIPHADLEQAVKFYTDFGLTAQRTGNVMSFRCDGRHYDSLHLLVGESEKKIHHVAMGATLEGLAAVEQKVAAAGLLLEAPPEGFSGEGLWFRNSHGLLFHIENIPPEAPVASEPEFRINSPGHYNRVNSIVMPPKSEISDPRPRKLGHVLLFSPDVDESIDFLCDVLGMRLSDRSKDIVAFCHCQGGSDHHVIALAKSGGIGFHHASFMVATPDEVGLGGYRMIEKGHTRGWGFGRHAIGSNFFHYVRDPWGSYAEYYSDIDYIGDSDSWEARDWPLEDSLHTWGPNPSEDFVHNYELD